MAGDRRAQIFVISDEVYEHINFSQQGHPACWRIRNCVSERWRCHRLADLSYDRLESGLLRCACAHQPEIRKVHQYLTFSVNTPAQLRLPICYVQNLSIILRYRTFMPEARYSGECLK